MERGINALKAAARRATNGQWPYLKNYNLRTEEIQRLMNRSAAQDSPYRIVADAYGYALAYRR